MTLGAPPWKAEPERLTMDMGKMLEARGQMERSRVREFLGRSPLFSGLAGRDVDLLAEVARPKALRKGEVLFLEGARAEGFYVVGEGQLKVFQLSPQGREQILHLIGPGETVAEAALFGGTTYPASAQALERTSVVFFPREEFARLLASRPALALNLIAALAQKLREFAGLIEQLSLASIRARLAQHLLDRLAAASPSTDGWVHLGVSKRALASRLGTVPETLSRSLAALVREGVVALDGRRVRVLDVEALREVASGLSE